MTPTPQPAFSILTLNLRFGLADDGPQAWMHRRPRLRQFIEAHTCDFMVFQEANDFQIDFLAECLPEYAIIGKRHPAPPFWQNNVILYRAPWKLDQSDHFYLSPTPDIPSRFAASHWPRQCTMGRFTAGPHELVCATTHLDFDETVQADSAKIILARIERMASNRPVILAGDFNCTPTSICHAVFTRPQHTTRPRRPAFQNALEPSFPGTFHDFKGGNGSRCIDWILYRGAIAMHHASVIPFTADTIYPSDHYPVTAVFLWKS
jgi:endonuclease/exonuclease/phosphatase family metal-dependent hydrolase